MRKIVLVDDDPAMRKLLTTLLEMEGFTVQAHSAFPILDGGSNQPDVILMDVFLGSQNGLEILKNLRSAGRLAPGVRVIMTSGMDMRYESAEAGADGFLLKPYMPEELFHLLSELIPDQDTA